MLAILTLSMSAHANDSTGYVATGGVQYLQNNDIEMYSEDLYISKEEIRVNYQFKNLTHNDITETVLFPLASLPANLYGNFVDTQSLFDSFKVEVDGHVIKPILNLRILIHPIDYTEYGPYPNYKETVDVTEAFKACGVSSHEILPLFNDSDIDVDKYMDVNQKIINCNNITLNQFIYDSGLGKQLSDWNTQLIYSWQQTFKANAITYVKHSYQPIVGFALSMGESEYEDFCMADSLSHAHSRQYDFLYPYKGVSYILTTGANWAKPITHFKLTVKRDLDEFVSFCWNGNQPVKKVAPDTFEVTETNFTPTHDLELAFFHVIESYDDYIN